jgi:hypothetical protein
MGSKHRTHRGALEESGTPPLHHQHQHLSGARHANFSAHVLILLCFLDFVTFSFHLLTTNTLGFFTVGYQTESDTSSSFLYIYPLRTNHC